MIDRMDLARGIRDVYKSFYFIQELLQAVTLRNI